MITSTHGTRLGTRRRCRLATCLSACIFLLGLLCLAGVHVLMPCWLVLLAAPLCAVNMICYMTRPCAEAIGRKRDERDAGCKCSGTRKQCSCIPYWLVHCWKVHLLVPDWCVLSLLVGDAPVKSHALAAVAAVVRRRCSLRPTGLELFFLDPVSPAARRPAVSPRDAAGSRREGGPVWGAASAFLAFRYEEGALQSWQQGQGRT